MECVCFEGSTVFRRRDVFNKVLKGCKCEFVNKILDWGLGEVRCFFGFFLIYLCLFIWNLDVCVYVGSLFCEYFYFSLIWDDICFGDLMFSYMIMGVLLVFIFLSFCYDDGGKGCGGKWLFFGWLLLLFFMCVFL